MDRVLYIVSALMFLALVVLVAPNILAMNRGKTLRNLALWLVAVLVLAVLYKTIGPESDHPLIPAPALSTLKTPPVLPQKDSDDNAIKEKTEEPGALPKLRQF